MKEHEVTIDIGCGPTNNTPFYDCKGEPTLAIDSNRGFLLRRLTQNHLGNFVEADGSKLPVAASVADKVLAIHFLEHVEDLSGVLDEVARILKPDGQFIVAVPHHRLEGIMSRVGKEYNSQRMHRRVINESALRNELERRGFSIVESKARGFVQAVYTTFSYFIKRRLLRDKELEPHTGHLLGGRSSQLAGIKGVAKEVIKSEIFMRLFSPFDQVYPFETYVMAVKLGNGN